MAENQNLRLLAHRLDGGADDVVRPRARPVCFADKTLLVLDIGEISTDVAGRAIGGFFELGDCDAANPRVRHARAHQQAIKQAKFAGFSSALRLARRHIDFWDRVCAERTLVSGRR